MRALLLSLFLIACLPALPSIAQTQADIAAEAKIYGVLPLAWDVHLSPDGNSLSLIAGIKGRQTFAIWHLDERPPTTLSTGTLEPSQLVWKGSDKLLASVYFTDSKNFMSVAAVTRLLTLNADGSGHRLVDFSDVTGWWGAASGQFQDNILSILPRDSQRVLLYGSSLHSNLVTVDVKAGTAKPFDLEGFYAYGWLVDSEGVVRLGEKTEYGA